MDNEDIIKWIVSISSGSKLVEKLSPEMYMVPSKRNVHELVTVLCFPRQDIEIETGDIEEIIENEKTHEIVTVKDTIMITKENGTCFTKRRGIHKNRN